MKPRFPRVLQLSPFVFLALSAFRSEAEVRLPKILSSHMVVQRNLPVHFWGWADPGEPVTVSFRGSSQTAQTSETGQWSVFLTPGAAGGPFNATVKGTNSITLEDILVGDVWVASGQSNMEFEMRKAATAATDLPQAAHPQIRLMIVKKVYADYAQPDLDGTCWAASTPDSAREFSAVAWYFAREIEQREHVPIGVIDSTWGGTVAEAWTSLKALGENPNLSPVFAVRGRMTDDEAEASLTDKVRARQIADAKANGTPIPQFPWHPPLNIWAPGMLYNGMIAPLTPFPIRGVIWYQGETNSIVKRDPAIYEPLFRTLIEDWRSRWQIGDFPFLYVQLANFKSTPLEDWAVIREAQRRTLATRNTGMAVTIDVGNPDNVHPTDKATVGHRLALAARSLTYSEAVESSGPLFRQVSTENASLRVWFDHAAGLKSKGPLTDFEIAGADGKFVPAQARIDGETVVLNADSVPKPVAVRYGWANSPECHLYNGAALPASPFTSAP